MTYVELIVVLSIFSLMTAVVLFNYGAFQGKVDIKNLASDIALQIVEAQKSSISGKLPPPGQQALITNTEWKPTYGVYFSLVPNNKKFIYFVDINQDGTRDDVPCEGSFGECLLRYDITKGNVISNLDVFYQDDTSTPLTELAITFVRPNSGAIFTSLQIDPLLPLLSPISYAEITVASPKAPSVKIKVYASGRIQVN